MYINTSICIIDIIYTGCSVVSDSFTARDCSSGSSIPPSLSTYGDLLD